METEGSFFAVVWGSCVSANIPNAEKRPKLVGKEISTDAASEYELPKYIGFCKLKIDATSN